MDSPARNVFAGNQADIGWREMRIMRSTENETSKGNKYTKHYDAKESLVRRVCLRPFQFLRSLYMSSERRRAAISHNQTNSTFYRLPVEILCAIAAYLSPVAILSLRRVCTKLRTCLAHFGPEIKSGSLFMAERYQFVFLLRQDRLYKLQRKYQRLCEETDSDSRLHHRGCSQCLTIHDSYHFSAGQLNPNTSPKSRICAGLEGYIELCEHFSWSAECLWHGFRVLTGLELRCSSFEHSRNPYGRTIESIVLPALNPRLFYLDGRIEMVRAFPLFKIDTSKVTTHEELSTALYILNGYVCPHLRTRSPKLFDGQRLTAECTGSKDNSRSLTDCDIPLPGYCLRERGRGCMFSSECRSPNCLTRYGLRRCLFNSLQTDIVVFEVIRTMLSGPTHASWKVQLCGSGKEEDAIKRNKRRSSRPADCDAQLWACQGLFCAGRYKRGIVEPTPGGIRVSPQGVGS